MPRIITKIDNVKYAQNVMELTVFIVVDIVVAEKASLPSLGSLGLISLETVTRSTSIGAPRSTVHHGCFESVESVHATVVKSLSTAREAD